MSAASSKEGAWWRSTLSFWPLGMAIAATSGFGWYAWALAFEITAQEGIQATRYEHFLRGKPNELGDTLAGFVGSLTLIWVVASVIQQSLELRAQRREFSEMVAAQENQALQLGKQVEILDFQLASLKQREVKARLDQILRKVVRTIEDVSSLQHWEAIGKGLSYDAAGEKVYSERRTKCGIFDFQRLEVDAQITRTILGIKNFIARVGEGGDIVPRSGKKSAAKHELLRIVESIDSALGLEGSLGPADAQRLRDLDLDKLRSIVISLSELDLWDPSGHDGYVLQP